MYHTPFAVIDSERAAPDRRANELVAAQSGTPPSRRVVDLASRVTAWIVIAGGSSVAATVEQLQAVVSMQVSEPAWQPAIQLAFVAQRSPTSPRRPRRHDGRPRRPRPHAPVTSARRRDPA